MATYTKKFADVKGNIFIVNEVGQRVGSNDNDLWVSYTKEATNEQYSCRLEAFSERFTAVDNNE